MKLGHQVAWFDTGADAIAHAQSDHCHGAGPICRADSGRTARPRDHSRAEARSRCDTSNSNIGFTRRTGM
jgi:hypothetical protein